MNTKDELRRILQHLLSREHAISADLIIERLKQHMAPVPPENTIKTYLSQLVKEPDSMIASLRELGGQGYYLRSASLGADSGPVQMESVTGPTKGPGSLTSSSVLGLRDPGTALWEQLKGRLQDHPTARRSLLERLVFADEDFAGIDALLELMAGGMEQDSAETQIVIPRLYVTLLDGARCLFGQGLPDDAAPPSEQPEAFITLAVAHVVRKLDDLLTVLYPNHQGLDAGINQRARSEIICSLASLIRIELEWSRDRQGEHDLAPAVFTGQRLSRDKSGNIIERDHWDPGPLSTDRIVEILKSTDPK